MAEVLEQVAAETPRVVAVGVERPEGAHAAGGVAVERGVGDLEHEAAIGTPDDLAHDRLVDRRDARRQHLLEEGLRVAQAAVRLACDHGERGRIGGAGLRPDRPAEVG